MLFPKTNSFISGRRTAGDGCRVRWQDRAGKDAQTDPDFSIIARVEAFIALGLAEARGVRRSTRWPSRRHSIHSALSVPDEISTFKQERGNRCPVDRPDQLNITPHPPKCSGKDFPS
ncbi:MAG: hypothetical protein U0361_04665 [Nitrospiraceae bacterium]